ncbi:MAG: site-specific DNA-methyltransferase [Candidatus Omnitrophica bacterium]|nr:site-specific DNA-methyltransferase [Candidatus Omnitrophota bacterium]
MKSRGKILDFPKNLKIKNKAILTKTPTGGIVLAPFAGSGTTGLAAKSTNRNFILIEKEAEYVEIAQKRLSM